MQIQCWGHWKITGLLYLYWPIRLGCYAMGLPISDSVWNCGRSLVLWVPRTSGSIGNGILGEYFPEREYNLLDPKRTRKRPKFQPYKWPSSSLDYCSEPHRQQIVINRISISQPSPEILTESVRSATYIWRYVAKNDFYRQNAFCLFLICNENS